MKMTLNFFYIFTSSYGLSIILLSVSINIILVPIFNIFEKLRFKDKQKKLLMRDMLNKINKNYKGRDIFIRKVVTRFIIIVCFLQSLGLLDF